MSSYHWIDGIIMLVLLFASFGFGVLLEMVIEYIKGWFDER